MSCTFEKYLKVICYCHKANFYYTSPIRTKEISRMEDEIEGFRVVARSLVHLGVKYMFGVVGIPVVEVKY